MAKTASDPSPRSTSTEAAAPSAAPGVPDRARPAADAAHTLALFQAMLDELRASRQREDALTFGFAGVLVLITAEPLLATRPGPGWIARVAAVVGIALLGWRVNGFLSENRNRQNQIKKVITATENSYPFSTDRAFVRLSDFKNLDGPGEWDKSDYSLADWDRSEYGMFLKVLWLVAMIAILVS